MPRKHRRRSWGSITEVTKGKKYVLRWVENTPEGRKRKCETFRGTYREASSRLDVIHVEHADDRPVPTMSQVYESWYLPDIESRMKPNTVRTYRYTWRAHIRPRWGDTPVDSVAPMDVQEWLMSMPKSTAQAALAIARKIMDIPVRYELVDRNKFRGEYVMPTASATTRDKGTYTLREAESALSAVNGTMLEGAFIAACFGSCRTGESLGIRPHEVRFSNIGGLDMALIPILRTAGAANVVMPDGQLKNRQSLRTIIVPGRYARRLAEIAEERMSFGYEWLSPAPDGSPMGRNLLRSEWSRVDLERRIPFANLRNSWRTFAQMEWGIDWDTLEVLMGHALPGVSGAHYIRPDDMQLAEMFSSEYKGAS